MSHPITRPLIAGNWKMNKGPQEATSFFRDFLDRCPPRTDRSIAFFPPALSFAAAAAAVAGRQDIQLGVQNVHWEDSGAFTGEVSAVMAAQAGARLALVGHSERRHVFRETDVEVARKTAAILASAMIPVVCVGEKLDEREAGKLQEVLLRQLDAVLEAIPGDAGRTLVVAYEPVWAIGTGINATPADASEAHAVLRERLAARYGHDLAGSIPILYGGSVKAGNAAELLDADGIDGLLVGGASLDAAAFAAICSAGQG